MAARKKQPTIEMTINEEPLPVAKKINKKKNVTVATTPSTTTPINTSTADIKDKEKESDIVLDVLNVEHDYRDIILKYDPTHNISIPVLTDYEIPLIIGKRATQIAYGSAPMIEPKIGMNHIDIAEEELRQKKTPYIIRRKIGTRIEYWKIADLSVNF